MLENYSADFKASMKVLVIDNNDEARKATIALLQSFGFKHIRQAGNGKKALGLIKTNKFTIVLCDWNIPEVSALSLLQLVRISHSTITLPFIIVSESKNIKDIKECISSGVSGIILKPLTEKNLSKELNDRHDNILLHQITLDLLTNKLIKALEQQ